MTDGPLDRIDGLERALTQLADAVESMAAVVATRFTRKDLEPMLVHVETARRLIGTSE